jgi:hypothetical protein
MNQKNARQARRKAEQLSRRNIRAAIEQLRFMRWSVRAKLCWRIIWGLSKAEKKSVKAMEKKDA